MTPYQKAINELASCRMFNVLLPPGVLNELEISEKYGKTLGQVREDRNAAVDRIQGGEIDSQAYHDCDGL